MNFTKAVYQGWIGVVLVSVLFLAFLVLFTSIDMNPSLNVDGAFLVKDDEVFLSFYSIDESQINLKEKDQVKVIDVENNKTLLGEVEYYINTDIRVEEGFVNQYFIRIYDGEPDYENNTLRNFKVMKAEEKNSLMSIWN